MTIIKPANNTKCTESFSGTLKYMLPIKQYKMPDACRNLAVAIANIANQNTGKPFCI